MADIIKICNTEKEKEDCKTVNDKVKPILSKRLQLKKEKIDRIIKKFCDHADLLDW
jgi:hypothetical protein